MASSVSLEKSMAGSSTSWGPKLSQRLRMTRGTSYMWITHRSHFRMSCETMSFMSSNMLNTLAVLKHGMRRRSGVYVRSKGLSSWGVRRRTRDVPVLLIGDEGLGVPWWAQRCRKNGRRRTYSEQAILCRMADFHESRMDLLEESFFVGQLVHHVVRRGEDPLAPCMILSEAVTGPSAGEGRSPKMLTWYISPYCLARRLMDFRGRSLSMALTWPRKGMAGGLGIGVVMVRETDGTGGAGDDCGRYRLAVI